MPGPRKLVLKLPTAPAAPPAAEPSFFERLGGVRGMIATGSRVGSGILGSTIAAEPGFGSVVGGAIGGAGEGLAELVEGSDLNPYRMGVEAALTAVPLGKVFGATRKAAALRSGALSGAGVIGRDWAKGEDVSPTEFVGQTALGVGLGALLGGHIPSTKVPSKVTNPPIEVQSSGGRTVKKLPGFTEASTAKPTAPTPQPSVPRVSNEVIPYRYDYAGGPAAKSAAKEVIEKLKADKIAEKLAAKQAAADRIISAREEAGVVAKKPSFSKSLSAPTEEGGTQNMRTPYGKPKKSGGGAGVWEETDESPSDVGALGQTLGVKPVSEAPAGGEPVSIHEQIRAGLIKAVERGALTEAEASMRLGESLHPTARYVFDQPGAGPMYEVTGGPSHESHVGAARLQELGIPIPEIPPSSTPSIPKPEPVAAAPAPPAETVAPVAPQTPTPPPVDKIAVARAQYPDEVNAELDKLGEAYRSTVPGAEKRVLGAKMAEIRDFFTPGKMRESWRGAPLEGPSPMPEGYKPPTTAEVPDFPSVAAESPERIGKTDELLNLLKGQPRNSELGAINPALLTHLGMGLGGAAVGAATDPFNNRFESALAGGAAGLGLSYAPQLLQSFGAAPEALQGFNEKIQAPGGIHQVAKDVFQTLPQIQRFNYLFSSVGLPANAIIGPWGSAIMGAIEHALTAGLEGSGDTRGWEALKQLTPQAFLKEYFSKDTLRAAEELVRRGDLGRSEGLGAGAMTGTVKDVLAFPGVAMTMGDEVARRILMRAGFTEEEARRITLTSEPEFQLPRAITNFGKGRSDSTKALTNILAPFRRTPANIWEQGMERFPGIGSLLQSERDLPDSLKQQLVQQLMSGGVAGASAFVGANLDPNSFKAKTARRYISNFAGQYSLPANMGFAAGQAIAGGKPIIPAAAKGGITDLPLPTTQPITELAKFVSAPSMQNIPGGWIPTVLKEAGTVLNPPIPKTPRRITRLRRP